MGLQNTALTYLANEGQNICTTKTTEIPSLPTQMGWYIPTKVFPLNA
jgi:hypothetical protein